MRIFLYIRAPHPVTERTHLETMTQGAAVR